MRQIINGQNLVLGTCYYPEHWDKSLWREDLTRMLDLGITVIRIAEFAWNKVEPKEGEYTFEFFDSFLDLAEEVGMKVIFSTPSATPPAWLTDKYPEVLNARQDGVLYRHGCRRHYNYNSTVYQKFVKNITTLFAAHYAKRPCIIGWQIDNELNCETNEFYSESDTYAFRDYLKEKYKTLDALNEAWGTVVWNQTYTSWGEIYVPRTVISRNATNPHQYLDYFRFVSHSAERFCGMQSEILKQYIKPDDFITTNGLFGNLDNHRMTRDSLDFMTYDSYPNFAYVMADYDEKDPMKDRKWSRNLMETRSVSPVFGIMEQQSGANGWNTGMAAPTPRPGQMTLWTMQSVAHGADYISYFRWRTAIFGTEIYWHGLLDYSGRENRRIRELREIKKKFDTLQEIAGSVYEAKVGILKDYDNIWDSQLDIWHESVDKVSLKNLFNVTQFTHTPADFVYLGEDLTLEDLKKYDVLFYPHALILTEDRMELLEQYVAEGGKLVMGCRTGYKQINGKCVMDYLPGLAAKVTGADVPEYSFVSIDEGTVHIDWNGRKIPALVFNDVCAALPGAEVAGTYTDSYYAGEPGLIRNAFGKGEAYYFGGAFSSEAVDAFLENLGVKEPWKNVIELPACCELAVREKNGVRYLFVLNYAKEACEIELKRELTALYSGEKVSGKITLDKYETAVYKL